MPLSDVWGAVEHNHTHWVAEEWGTYCTDRGMGLDWYLQHKHWKVMSHKRGAGLWVLRQQMNKCTWSKEIKEKTRELDDLKIENSDGGQKWVYEKKCEQSKRGTDWIHI